MPSVLYEAAQKLFGCERHRAAAFSFHWRHRTPSEAKPWSTCSGTTGAETMSVPPTSSWDSERRVGSFAIVLTKKNGC